MRNFSRVLIVDDEPNVRLMFRTALESAYRVTTADDGESALKEIERGGQEPRFDLILLDLQMPGMGGMEVLRRLREAGNETPVVIVTAHGSIPDAVAAMKLGAIDFLTKPMTPDLLRRVVSEVIERHAADEPGIDHDRVSWPGTAAPSTVVTIGPPALDLSGVKKALNRLEFDRAAALLEQALDADPESAEALTLMGVLQESRGQDHAAYHAYKSALNADPDHAPAQDNLRRYCERFGLDFTNPAINPAARD